MQENNKAQIYLTDLFLDCGNVIPFVIIETYQIEGYFSYEIACGLHKASDKKIISSRLQRSLSGKSIVDNSKDEFPDLLEFFAKKELANLIKEEASINISNNFKLQECSFYKLFLLTLAEMNKEDVRSAVNLFSDTRAFYDQLRMLVTPHFGNPLSNTWQIEK